jgi:transposase
MSEKRRKFDQDFKDGAVRIVLESGRPVAEIARELDVHEGTLGNWVNKVKAQQQPGALRESERDELNRLRKENAELRMQRDVLKRSVVLWVDEATGRKS